MRKTASPKTPEWQEKETGVPAKDVRALAREWGKKRVYLAPGGWGNGHGGACRNQTGIQWARVMVCLAAMQGLGKPGINMGNLQWGCPIDFNFYFPGYADGGMSGDLENTSMPVELYQRMPQLPTMSSNSRPSRASGCRRRSPTARRKATAGSASRSSTSSPSSAIRRPATRR